MLWSKRRPSRPSDPSSASQQQPQQQQKAELPIPSSSSSTVTAFPSPGATTPSSSPSATAQSPGSSRLPLVPLDPTQISISNTVVPNPSGTPRTTQFVVSDSRGQQSRYQAKPGESKLAMNSQNHDAPSSTLPRPGPSSSRPATDATQTRPTFQPTWTQGIPASEPSLFQELSSFQFGAPAMPSSPSSPPSSSHSAHEAGDDDEFVSPLTVNDVTPRPSVVSTGTSDLPNSYRSHPHNVHSASSSHTHNPPHSVPNTHSKSSSVHNHSYGEVPLYTTSSHPSQLPSPPPETHPPASKTYTRRDRSSSPPPRGRRPPETATQSTFGESSTIGSASNSGFASSSSSASASVTSLTSASNSMSPDDDLSSTVGSSRSGTQHDRDIEFSSEEEYEYDDEDGFEYDEQDIEVSSAYWDGGHPGRPDSFYYFGGGGSSAGMGSGLSITTMGRRGSVPMAIPGASDTTSTNAASNSGVPRDREGSMATLRRPSRSVDDELRSYTFGAPNRNAGAVPQSDPLTRGEWSAMESRQEQMRTVGPFDTSDVVTPTLASSSRSPGSSTSASNSGDITSLGFDSDWGDLRGGITSLTANDIAGLVDPNTTVVATRRPSGGLGLSFFSSGNASPGPNSAGATGRSRMGSFFSMISARRQSEATVTDDTFTRNVRRWDGTYGSRRRDWSFRREKGTSAAQPGSQIMSERHGAGVGMERTDSTHSVVFGSSQKANVSHDGDKERRKSPKGMAVGTSEIWSNELLGRFKVDRRAPRPVDPSKPPQQRLNFIHFQGSDSETRNTRPGPPVTVHKHSKAIAFSISRQHAKPRRLRDTPGSAPGQRGIPVREVTVPRASMIMLAPKRVQEQYTNTTTTRRLDTHGLLEDIGLRRERERRERELERERERRRRTEEQRHNISESSTTRSTSSVNSLGNGRELYPTPPPASAPSLHTYPPPPAHEVRKHPSSRSLRSLNSAEHSHPVSNPGAALERVSRPTARRVRDPYDFDDPDEDELPTRTPHAETYATIDPARVEHVRQLQSRLDDQPSRSRIRRFLGLSTNAAGGAPLSATIDSSFKAPWLTMAPRAKQEEHERVVANLNESFIDVGLLPSRPTNKSKASQPQKQKQTKPRHTSGANGSNIFEQVPPDSLYMLLPLWPGETDPASEKLPGEPKKPHIPLEDRLYLLVYYVADEVNPQEHDTWSKSETDSRNHKKSRSPTTSVDAAGRRTDDRSILLTAFHVSARLVGYDELRTSGMRVPDEGLSVTGPMSEAVKTMPSSTLREQHHLDFIIAMCHSRDAGMEFVQEGLVKMGLCLVVSPQPRPSAVPPDETEEMEEPDVVLSPIGRAVVEMAWVGCMALTSFGLTI